MAYVKQQIRLSSTYQTVFHLVFQHDSYKEGRCTALELAPTEQTKGILRKVGLVSRSEEDGLRLLSQSPWDEGQAEEKTRKPLPDYLLDQTIYFQLSIKDKSFYGLSNIDFGSSGKILYISGRPNNKKRKKTSLLDLSSLQSEVSSIDQQGLDIHGVHDSFHFQEPVHLQLHKDSGEVVYNSEDLDKRHNSKLLIHYPRLTSLTEGLYYKVVGKQRQPFFLSFDRHPSMFGLIALSVRSLLEGDYKDKRTINFAAKKVHYRYYLVGETIASLTDVKGERFGQEAQNREEMLFDKPHEVTLINGRQAKEITTKSEYLLRNKIDSKEKCQLTLKGKQYNKVIQVPIPDKSVLKPDRDEAGKMYAVSYIYL